MSFDAMPEDKEESHFCKCGGNITKRKNTSGSDMIIWECDKCDFEAADKSNKKSNV